MPPNRRTRLSSGPASKSSPLGAQKTLSFAGSKPSLPSLPKEKSSLSTTTSAPPSKPLSQDISPSLDLGHTSSAPAIQTQAKLELENVKRSPEEEKARKVTDAQIKRFWRERENERMSRRVHQGELSVEEKVLRFWDMSSQYGPAIGIARMKRWVRAKKLGLEPPIEVLAVLLKEEDKGNNKIERAYVDELMSSKFVVGDA